MREKSSFKMRERTDRGEGERGRGLTDVAKKGDGLQRKEQ